MSSNFWKNGFYFDKFNHYLRVWTKKTLPRWYIDIGNRLRSRLRGNKFLKVNDIFKQSSTKLFGFKHGEILAFTTAGTLNTLCKRFV
jgi:hypothetical protein